MDSQPAAITLRPVSPADEEFLRALYISTRMDEFAPLGLAAAQLDTLLQLQFNAQRHEYEARYSAAGHKLILHDARPVGRVWVGRSADAITLVDIALLPDTRGAGIGTRLITELIAEAATAGQPLRLSVLKTNQAALRLYTRLGFAVTDADGIYLQMEHRARPAAPAT